MQISAVFGTRENFDSGGVFWNRSFRLIQATTFFRVYNFENI